MKDSEFVKWIADRIVNVYGESENVDFIHRLRKVVENLEHTEYKESNISEMSNNDNETPNNGDGYLELIF
jgi:hypothetical protein